MSAPTVHWASIDTVLLDMDGTLLDLSFDNYFWLELVPREFARRRGIDLPSARADLTPRFLAHRGTLNWYCTDFWSRELGLNIATLKYEAREKIAWLPGAESFLSAVRAAEKRMLLVTNAHWDSLRVKRERTGLARYFDALVSSHGFGYPKEHPGFWSALQREYPFDSQRAVLFDDSPPVLRAARDYGIGHVIAIVHPDSTQPVRDDDEFPSVRRISELSPELRKAT